MAQTETERDLANIGEYADRRVRISVLHGKVKGLMVAIDICRGSRNLDDAIDTLTKLARVTVNTMQAAIDAAHERLHKDLKAICEEPTPPTAGA